MADFELAVPGVIYIGSTARQKEDTQGPAGSEASGGGTSPHVVVHLGAAAGWMRPRGIRQWAREVSAIRRSALSESLRKELGATLPHEQIAPAKMPLASRASRECPFIAVEQNLVEKLLERGVRVHTVGFDRISGGFYYLAEGGQSPKARVEGDLIEMVSPALEAAGDNADLDSLLEGVIDRILLDVSKGDINEAAVELAGALPRLCTDGRGTDGCDLEAFEREAASLVSRSAPFETLARVLASRLSSSKHSDVVTVPLFGEARREKEPVITVHLGSNTSHSTQLAARDRWLVSGEPNREITLAPQRANTVRVPTASAPAGGDNGTNAGRPPARPPAAGRPAVATTPVSSSSAPVARPAPISNRLTASAPPARATLPRPAQIAPQPPASDRNPSPSQRGPASSPRAPLAAPEIVFKSESEPPASEVEHVDLESLPEPLFANPRPVHEAPSEPEKGPRAPEVASFGDEPLFRQDAPVQHENPPVEHEELASEEAIEDPPDAPEVVSPPALPVEGRIFVPAARGGRQDIEPEPMTQPSQRRRREMEEAQARAVKDARRLALWLVIGVIFILVLVYVISNVH